MAAAAGDQISQGNSEVIVWNGDYQNSEGSEMIKKLETNLKKAGWEFQVGFKDNDCVLFGLYRTDPERRALIGFFVPAGDTFIFAVIEMVRAGERSAVFESQTQIFPPSK